MNKQDAAEYLGVSVRTLENMMRPEHSNHVRFSYVKGKTRDVADFDALELDRIKSNLPTSQAPLVHGEVVTPKPRNSETAYPATPKVETTQLAKVETAQIPNLARAEFVVIPAEQMGFLLEELKAGRVEVPIADKPNLTVKEASRLFGRSEKELREAIKSGQLTGIKMLRGATGVRRADLDEWNKSQ